MPRAFFSTSAVREGSCLKVTKEVQWFPWDTQEQHGTHCHSGKRGRENQVSQWGMRVWCLLQGRVWVGREGALWNRGSAAAEVGKLDSQSCGRRLNTERSIT